MLNDAKNLVWIVGYALFCAAVLPFVAAYVIMLRLMPHRNAVQPMRLNHDGKIGLRHAHRM